MTKRPEVEPEELRSRLQELVQNFRELLKTGELREKVLYLVKVDDQRKLLGISMLPGMSTASASERILDYLRRFESIVIAGAELGVVSGIQEYARRIRELRKEKGWKIVSGAAVKDMADDPDADEYPAELLQILKKMDVDDYILVSDVPDRDAAHRWFTANSIRKSDGSVIEKLLKYFRLNVDREISGEELRYVAGDEKTEWARRTRELRTQYGWPIVTKNTGRPELGIGYYVLEADRKNPDHDRKTPDRVRIAVLERDGHSCFECGWNYDDLNPADPRKSLELHHLLPHNKGGENTFENLVTLCNVCHDDVHAKAEEVKLRVKFLASRK